jgi:serine/threonine-protein kinase
VNDDEQPTRVGPDAAPTPFGPPPDPRLAQDPARRLARFVVTGELGRGGMGVVLRAFDPVVGRHVAIKLLLDPSAATPEIKARFRREVEAAGRLQHPGIVSILEAGEHAGQPYLVTELIDGESLAALLERGALPRRRAVEVVRDVARALAFAHAQGVLHRDVKPANVLVDRAGRARLIDFGLARLGASQLTRTGQLLGTPAYMAPEQAGDSPSRHGPAVDVYSLGAVLYRALTGRPPVEADSVPSLLKRLLTDPVTPPRAHDPTIEPALEATTLRCLEKEPEARPSADALATALDAWLSGPPDAPAAAAPPTATGGRTIAAAVLVGAGLMAGLFFATRSPPPPARPELEPAAVASATTPEEAPAASAPAFPPGFEQVSASGNGALRLTSILGARGRRHAEGIKAVSWTADGRLALTADSRWDGRTRGFLHVWDVERVTELRAWPAHWGGVVAALSPDGRRAVSGGGHDDLVCVWDVETGRELTRQGVPRRGKDGAEGVRAVQLLPDGRTALNAHFDGRLTRLALEEGAREEVVARLPAGLMAVAPLPSGDEALVLLASGTRALVDLRTGAVRTIASDGGRSPWGLFVRADGLTFRFGDDDELAAWRAPASVEAFWKAPARGRAAAWVPGGDRLLIGLNDAGGLLEWRSGRLQPFAQVDDSVWALAADARGRALVGTEGRTLSLLAPGKDVWGPDPAWAPACCIAVAGDRFVVGFEDGHDRGTTRVFDVASGRELASFEVGVEWVRGVGLAGERILVAGSNGSSPNLSLWRLPPSGTVERLWLEQARYPAGASLYRQGTGALSPDGGVVLSGGEQGTIYRWTEPEWAPHALAQLDGFVVRSLVFDRDEPGRTAFAAGVGLEHFPPRSGRLAEVPLDLRPPRPALALDGGPCVVASLSGGRAVAGCLDGRVLTWRPGDEPSWWPDAHEGSVRGVAVSPDGSRVATCGDDSLVILWDARRRQRLDQLDLSAVADVGRCLAFVSDRELIVGTSRGLLLRFALKQQE